MLIQIGASELGDDLHNGLAHDIPQLLPLLISEQLLLRSYLQLAPGKPVHVTYFSATVSEVFQYD